MQGMLVTLSAISTNSLTDTKKKSSTTCKHYFGEHNSNEPPCLSDQFQVIIKCSNKFDCLIKATCLRRKLEPFLKVQTHSIHLKNLRSFGIMLI